MSRNLGTRLAKLELWRAPRPPYVVRVDFPMTAEDRTAVANARGRVAALPYKCATVEEWLAQHAARGSCNDPA
jgi:hypothetical protein